ncbi:Bromodomain containing protein [Pyrenophora tritici-repentis]|nr:Bromodomain containing protein [Pyrenophora tritici-repentis]
MAVANNTSLATPQNTALPKSAARKPPVFFHGPMAVMTSPAVDKSSLDLKASAFAPADAMAVDTEANGVHDVLFDDPEANTNFDDALAQPKPTTNGNHSDMDMSAPAAEPAIEPTTNVSAGIDGVAQFLPENNQDSNSLFGDSDLGTTVANAVEAPTSDYAGGARDTNCVIVSKEENAPADSMDTTADASEAAKPTESSGAPTKPMNDLSIQTNSPAIVDREMEDAPSSGKVRPREDDDEDMDGPEAKRTKTEEEAGAQTNFKLPELPPAHGEPNGNGGTPGPASDSAHEASGVHRAVDWEAWPTTPMTEAQNKFLLERIRNTKKIKVSLAFKDPVDPVALGIPQYPEIVKHPMDLSTMESKLKEKKYTYVRDFMADLDQMITNSELFNNKQHPVTQAGYNLRAYFLKGMGKMPRGAAAEEPVKPAKAKKPTVNTAQKARRESRVAPPPTVKSPAVATPAATSPQAAWPLQQDGTPLIRRDSSTTDGRPKREIHRPSKDLPYTNAKPRRKKFQQELKFCESVLTELMKPKYSAVTYPFITPVDPVALNIPSYLKIIKKPMDFGTIEKNLKNGVYQSAKDFYADAQLVFQNCYKFNPEGDAAQFLAIQQQIAQLNATAQQLLQQQTGSKRASPKLPGKKKKGAAPPAKRKSLPLAVPPPAKPMKSSAVKKAKAPAPLSFAQKQEISEGISTLGDLDMRRAVQIIRNGCPHLANVNDDEMELDMEDINDDTLRELLRFIKSLRGPKGAAVADEDFEPPRQVSKQTASRPKKNKPMGKSEQEDNMRKIQEKLQSFQGGASGSSQSPPVHDASSDDDESSGSESEEE